MRNKKASRLSLDIQAYVAAETAKCLNTAVEHLRVQNEVIGRDRSFTVKVAIAAWSFVLITVSVATYFIGPGVVKEWVQKSVDEHMTVPEIENAANRILNEQLDVLATEKMLPFEERANEIQEKVVIAKEDLDQLKHNLNRYLDLNLARAYDRDAYNRILARGNHGSDDYSLLCKAVANEIRLRLVEEKEAFSFVIMAETGRNGSTYRGPFSMDEIYEQLTNKESELGAINLVKLDKLTCFNSILLEIATTSKNLKTAISAISALEKMGAPSSGFEYLVNVSNWVATVNLQRKQFPADVFKSAMKKLRAGNIYDAKNDMENALLVFPELDKLRAMAIVEALARTDIEGANKMYNGFCGPAIRWKKIAECYCMAVTGDVSKATDLFIECHNKYPTIAYQMAREPFWMVSRWFDESKIVKALKERE